MKGGGVNLIKSFRIHKHQIGGSLQPIPRKTKAEATYIQAFRRAFTRIIICIWEW